MVTLIKYKNVQILLALILEVKNVNCKDKSLLTVIYFYVTKDVTAEKKYFYIIFVLRIVVDIELI